jgi:hypothetical protein
MGVVGSRSKTGEGDSLHCIDVSQFTLTNRA